jgi:hypothetical protein
MLAATYLGSHIPRRAHGLSSQIRSPLRRLDFDAQPRWDDQWSSPDVEELGESQVDDDEVSRRVEHDVGRFQVAVDDPERVERLE